MRLLRISATPHPRTVLYELGHLLGLLARPKPLPGLPSTGFALARLSLMGLPFPGLCIPDFTHRAYFLVICSPVRSKSITLPRAWPSLVFPHSGFENDGLTTPGCRKTSAFLSRVKPPQRLALQGFLLPRYPGFDPVCVAVSSPPEL